METKASSSGRRIPSILIHLARACTGRLRTGQAPRQAAGRRCRMQLRIGRMRRCAPATCTLQQALLRMPCLTARL